MNGLTGSLWTKLGGHRRFFLGWQDSRIRFLNSDAPAGFESAGFVLFAAELTWVELFTTRWERLLGAALACYWPAVQLRAVKRWLSHVVVGGRKPLLGADLTTGRFYWLCCKSLCGVCYGCFTASLDAYVRFEGAPSGDSGGCVAMVVLEHRA